MALTTADPPFWVPIIWPVANIVNMVSRGKDETKPKLPKPESISPLIDHLPLFFASIRTCLMALAAMYIIYSDFDYPAFGRGKTLKLEWMLPIIIRNIIGLIVIAYGWDWFLYFSPWKKQLHKYKYNQIYPTKQQWSHDAFWSFTATIIGSLTEICICYCYSNGIFKYNSKSIFGDPIKNIFFMLIMTHCRLPHFFIIHRFIHPWRTTIVPDVGRFLYKYVHSLHHKSNNPSAVSGTSMHPIEAALYYSAGFVYVPFNVHPLIPVACVIDCAIGAWLGHDGFQWPGSCDYFHQLHHYHFDCNYGNPQIPLDYFFGSAISCKEDLRKCWGAKVKDIGKAANEKVSPTHKQGKNH